MDFLKAEVTCFDNSNDNLIPEIWTRESLLQLQSNMVMGALVRRDYSSQVSNFGDVVNAHRPADFSGERKTDTDQVTIQDAISVPVRVPLDQHVHVSFILKDGELSKSLPDLIEYYMRPAAREMAEKIDQILTGQVVRFTSAVGGVNAMDASNARQIMLDANTKLHENRAPVQNRYLVVGPRAENHILSSRIVTEADKRGDAGTALRNASIGHIDGFDTFMDQNVPHVRTHLADIATGETDAAVAAGQVAVATDAAYASLLSTGGEYVFVEGDDVLRRTASVADDSGDADITLATPLEKPVASGALVTVFLAAAADGNGDTSLTGDDYPAGWQKRIRIDGLATGKELQTGSRLTVGTGSSSVHYTVINARTVANGVSSVLLDRPLEGALANNAVVFPGPGANLAFHKDAIALVVRPLAEVPASSGADSFVASYEGLSMRVTMQYQGREQGMLITFDLLCGVAILDDRLAVAVYS